jgi:hypothetical protein
MADDSAHHPTLAPRPEALAARDFKKYVKQNPDVKVYMLAVETPYEEATAAQLLATNWNKDPVTLASISAENIAQQEAKRHCKEPDPKDKVPSQYHDLLGVFSKDESKKLPPSRLGFDYEIKLQPDTDIERDIGYAPLRRYSDLELREIKRSVDEGRHRGFIVPSKAAIASQILLAEKPGGRVRFCVDFRKVNAKSIKDRGPIPLIDEVMGAMRGCKHLTKLDIRQAFHRIRLTEESQDLTTFRTSFGSFKYTVLPFGLTNGPAAWQRLINECLFENLGQSVTAYLDDILVYSKTLEDHVRHVRWVLEKLQEWDLQADVSKCEFHTTEVKYLGMIVSTEGMRMDPTKVEALLSWEAPQSPRDVSSFLGAMNFYRRFIAGFGEKAKPLTRLLKKDTPWAWTEDQQNAFDEIKQTVASQPVLRHFDPLKETVIETDASDITTGGVLSQYHNGVLHPVAFYSRQMLPAGCNYEIYDKELLAIVTGFEQWEPELKSSNAPVPITVITDHQALKYFTEKRRLSRR